MVEFRCLCAPHFTANSDYKCLRNLFSMYTAAFKWKIRKLLTVSAISPSGIDMKGYNIAQPET